MTLLLTDKTDFPWLLCSWSSVSHPSLCLRVKLFGRGLNLFYFRIRPKAYLNTYPPGVTDSRIVWMKPSWFSLEASHA